MTDLRRLEKEEKIWMEKSAILDKLDGKSKERIRTMKSSIATKDEGFAACQSTPTLDNSLNMEHAFDHCDVSLSRIKSMTESIDSLAAEAHFFRASLYNTYNNRHKFRGYLRASDPKALIQAVALG
jgi:hypothetical protein